VQKKGSRIVNGVYIDPEDQYADAICASKLALGGAIKYKVKDEMGPYITTAWLTDNVVPSIGKRYAQDVSLIRNLGLAMLWLACDEDASKDLNLPEEILERVHSAYNDIPADDKPQQPVSKVQLHVYRHEDETIIEELVAVQSTTTTSEPSNTGDALARVPADSAGGGNGAMQHVLQTVVLQQRNLQQQMDDMRVTVHQNDQANRVWMENKFRLLNDNVRRFGGATQGGLARQDSRRQAEVRRSVAEGPPVNYLQRGRQWPKLAPNIKDLMVLWGEYEHGIAGRKAAKDWTREERGGGGDKKVKQTFYRRNCIWKMQRHLINKGKSIHAANAVIATTYGSGTSITNISASIVRDRKTCKAHGGLHPNFR